MSETEVDEKKDKHDDQSAQGLWIQKYYILCLK